MVGVYKGISENQRQGAQKEKRRGKGGRCLPPILKNCPTFNAAPLIFDNLLTDFCMLASVRTSPIPPLSSCPLLSVIAPVLEGAEVVCLVTTSLKAPYPSEAARESQWNKRARRDVGVWEGVRVLTWRCSTSVTLESTLVDVGFGGRTST